MSSAGTALAAPVLSTVLKPAGAPSCVNHQTVRQNIHWDSPVDTEFTSQDARATGHQGIVVNETYMNFSSNQHTHVTTATGCPIQLSTDNTEGRRDYPCFRCGKQGHKQQRCWERNLFCMKCQCNNHNTEAYRRYPSTENTPPGIAFNDNMYHPIVTPPILSQQPEPQPPAMFNIPRQQEIINPTYPHMSPAASNMTDALTQTLTQVMQNKQESNNKRLIKNIFDGTDKSKCIDWLIQVEAAAQFMNAMLRDIVLSQVSPVIYSVLKGLPANATDEEVKQLREGEVYKISSMEELEKEVPRNWVPERECRDKLEELMNNNPFSTKNDFLKSSCEGPLHRKVLLEDKDISNKTIEDFNKLCDKYDNIISKNSGDIGKTMLVEMEIDTGNHP